MAGRLSKGIRRFFSAVGLGEQSSTPSSETGFGFVYPKADKQLYYLDSSGTESEISVSGHTHTELDITDLQNYAVSGHDHTEPFQTTISTNGVSTATVDFSTGRLQGIDLEGATGTVTVTFSGTVEGDMYGVRVYQGSVDRDITWPAGVLWANGGTPPVVTAGNNALDFFQFLSMGGTSFLGMYSQDHQ